MVIHTGNTVTRRAMTGGTGHDYADWVRSQGADLGELGERPRWCTRRTSPDHLVRGEILSNSLNRTAGRIGSRVSTFMILIRPSIRHRHIGISLIRRQVSEPLFRASDLEQQGETGG